MSNLNQSTCIFCSIICQTVSYWTPLWELTHKQLETHGCIINIVATDVLVLKHHDININSVDGPVWYTHTFIVNNIWNKTHKLKKKTSGVTHWGRVMHIFVSKLTIIGSDNGLSPGWHQVIIWTNAEILLIRTSGTNFSGILSEIHTFLFKKMHLKMSSGKWLPSCLGLNVLGVNYRTVDTKKATCAHTIQKKCPHKCQISCKENGQHYIHCFLGHGKTYKWPNWTIDTSSNCIFLCHYNYHVEDLIALLKYTNINSKWQILFHIKTWECQLMFLPNKHCSICNWSFG